MITFILYLLGWISNSIIFNMGNIEIEIIKRFPIKEKDINH